MSDLPKPRDPDQGLLKERKKKRKWMAEAQALQRLVQQMTQDMETLTQERDRLKARVNRVCKTETEEIEPYRRLTRVSTEIVVEGRLEKAYPLLWQEAVLQIGSKLGKALLNAELVMAANSRLLQPDPATQAIFTQHRMGWILQIQRDRNSPAYFLSIHELATVWDSALETLKAAALTVSPDTTVKIVHERMPR